MNNHLPPSPFGITIMGADQLDLLLQMTYAVSNFSIFTLYPLVVLHVIGYGFCDTCSESPMSMVISVNGVVPMDVSSLANCVSYCFRNVSNFV